MLCPSIIFLINKDIRKNREFFAWFLSLPTNSDRMWEDNIDKKAILLVTKN